VEKEYIRTLKSDAVDALIEMLDGYTGYYDDLHNEVFNMDYYMVYTSDAKKLLGDGCYDAIGRIVEYEQFNFGNVNTDLSEPTSVVNMMYYIIGEQVLTDINMYDIVGDVQVGDDEINNKLIAALKDYAINI
jgi:hypothetical protein